MNTPPEPFTFQDAINGLKHVSDDHKCCAVFIAAVIRLLEKIPTDVTRKMAGYSRAYDRDRLVWMFVAGLICGILFTTALFIACYLQIGRVNDV